MCYNLLSKSGYFYLSFPQQKATLHQFFQKMKLLLDWQPPSFFSPSNEIPPKMNAGWYIETASRESHAQQRTIGWMEAPDNSVEVHPLWMDEPQLS
jgi:hypothetical protein